LGRAVTATAAAAERNVGSVRGDDRPALFAGLWGLFVLTHMSATYFRWFQFGDKVELVLGALAWLGGAALLLGPSSVVRLVVATVLFLAYKAYLLPMVPNHILFAMFIAVTILGAVALGALRWHGVGGQDRLRRLIFARLAPVLAVELLVMYFFVVLHKLNRDYLNPEVSCGFLLYEEIVTATDHLLPLAAWMGYPCLLGALFLEAAIPLCLFFRRTRTLGILLGLVFHTMLALHPNLYIYSSSVLLFACYTVFLPRGFVSRLRARTSWLPRLASWQLAGIATVVGLLAAVGLAAAAGFERGAVIDELHKWAPGAAKTFFFVTTAIIIAGFVSVLAEKGSGRRLRYPTPAQLLRGAGSVLMLVPLLMLLNGFSPYLALKTGTSFAMFSNLRTEGGVNNHLFMPRLPVPDYQDDMVRVVESNDPRLQGWADQGLQATTFEFRRHLAERAKPDLRVVFHHNGERHELDLKGRDGMSARVGELLEPPGWLERRLLLFRPVPVENVPMPCSH
jgi:hypothetical protein